MTTANIHYLIGWAGAVLIVIIIAAAWVLVNRASYEDDSKPGSKDGE